VVKVRLIANLEELQPVANFAGHISGFLGRSLGRAVAHIEPEDQPPSRCPEKTRQRVDRLGSNRKQPVRHPVRVQIAGGNAKLGLGRGRIEFQPAKLAGVAADAQYSLRTEQPEMGNQIAIGSGKERWIGQLCQLVTQAGVCLWNPRRTRDLTQRQFGRGTGGRLRHRGRAPSRCSNQRAGFKQKVAAIHDHLLVVDHKRRRMREPT
jgi:hypothetical protein